MATINHKFKGGRGPSCCVSGFNVFYTETYSKCMTMSAMLAMLNKNYKK